MEWKLDLPPGKSPPVVAGDVIFLTAHEGDKLLTLAIDARSGKLLWRGEVTRTRTQKRNTLNDAAAPTPVTDGKNVYAFFADFGFVAYSAAGKELWRAEKRRSIRRCMATPRLPSWWTGPSSSWPTTRSSPF